MKKIALLIAFAVVAISAYSQPKEDCFKTSWFIQGQGGIAMTLRNNNVANNFSKHIVSPHVALSVGKFFIPELGARLQVAGWESRNYMNDWNNGRGAMYNKNYFQTNLDVLLSVMNLFDAQKYHTFDLLVIGGAGYAHGFNDNSRGISSSNSFVPRAGLQGDWRLSERVSINAEVANSWVPKKFDTNTGHEKSGSILTTLLGITYRFGGNKNCGKAMPAHATTTPARREEPRPRPTPAAAPTTTTTTTTTVNRVLDEADIFFKINSAKIEDSQLASLEEVALYLLAYPRAKVSLTGYADKGTGTAAVNQRLSQERVDAVAKALIKDHGIDPSRIIKKAEGDRVQPFRENDLNRVTIAIVSETQTR